VRFLIGCPSDILASATRDGTNRNPIQDQAMESLIGSVTRYCSNSSLDTVVRQTQAVSDRSTGV
jgi:hypothetical protein